MRPHVTLGVTGGIAAYKAVELVRAFQQAGLDPHVVLTRSAENFIAPLTFSAITGHKTVSSLWQQETFTPEAPIDHIAEAQATRALIVAPATAHTLARFAHGLADDFLTTLYLATTAPVLLAPAMNVAMWSHPATQANLRTLEDRGHVVIPPGSGFLACGMTGDGRLADPAAIVAATLAALDRTSDLSQETILITAGGTREPLDPVRFLGNRSSGKMGFALASVALARGASVILVTAPTALPPPPGAQVVPVSTAEEMLHAVLEHLPRATAVISTAAVADFRPAAPSAHKIKRAGNPSLNLTLEPTPDILREVVARRSAGTLVIAFAAETDHPLENGRTKLLQKAVDAIVINDVSALRTGFDHDTNAAIVLSAQSPDSLALPLMPKSQMAHRLLDHLLTLRAQTPRPSPSAAASPSGYALSK